MQSKLVQRERLLLEARSSTQDNTDISPGLPLILNINCLIISYLASFLYKCDTSYDKFPRMAVFERILYVSLCL